MQRTASRALKSWIAIAIAGATSAAAEPPAGEAPPVASGTWSVGTVVEPDSVDEVTAAVAATAAGFTLAVAREPGKERVIGIFRLPPKDQDFLDESRSVVLQLDDGARLEPPRLGGGLKSTTFVLSDGVGEPAIGPLRDLMEVRNRIRVQYPLAGGGYKVVELAATGVKAAIATLLGVPEEVTPAARDLALARQVAVDGCLGETKAKDRDRCMERLAGCAQAETAEALRACVTGKR